MSLEPGQSLGPYKVVTLLGAGGMGQVWQATDTQLHRDVALKILPDAFAADRDRLARFKREAQILARLNHPNIAAIYGIEEADGTRALVLELVEGPTLADRIAQGPIPLDEALPIAKQIAEALEAAHEAGVIHRDLKPANIKVREDGTVKVLDFGLAKAFDTTPEGDPSQSPTLTAAATQMGVILGTAAYMSPEQARGKPVDKRADIWAFGVVLYEMLTGARPFQGEDVSVTLASVMKSDVNAKALPSDLPQTLRTVIRQCLQKDPSRRIRDVGDVRLAMDGAFETPVPQTADVMATPRLRVWQRPTPVAIAAVAVACVTGLAGWNLRPLFEAPPDLMRFTITPPEGAPLASAPFVQDLAVSPDGTRIVYSGVVPGGSQLHLRPIDQLDGAPLRGTAGGVAPFVSPDGEWVGFTDAGATTLQKVSMFGGPPVTLCESENPITGASWGADDQIIFGTFLGGLFRVSAGGGEPEALTRVDDEQGVTSHFWPSVIPEAQAVLFVTATGSPATGHRLALLSLDSGEVTDLGLAGTSPRYVATGHLVYADFDGSVRAVAFDRTRLEVTGNPVPVVEGVMVKTTSGAANFTVSEAGRLVYIGGPAGGSGVRSFVWVDRDGREEPLPLPPRAYATPRLSPDGTRLAVTVIDQGQGALWVYDVVSARGLRLTQEANVRLPVWTPDQQRVVFAWNVEGTNELYWVPPDGSGQAERLTTSAFTAAPTSVTPDGDTVLFTRIITSERYEIWEVPLDGEQTPRPVLQGEFIRGNAEVSPDGRWLAYRSNESGQMEIYLQPYPGPGPTVPVSIGGGDHVIWSHDGSELFYRLGTRVMAVSVTANGTVGTPTELFGGNYYARPGFGRLYHVAPDGRFLMLKSGDAQATDTATPPQITVVLNWFKELEARVPLP